MKPLALSRISFNSDTMTFKSALPPDPSDLNLAPLLKRERLKYKIRTLGPGVPIKTHKTDMLIKVKT